MREKLGKEKKPLQVARAFLEEMNFCPCQEEEKYGAEGKLYRPPEEVGEGYYWYYEKEGFFSVGVMDLRLKEDLLIEYQQWDFISVSYYDRISAEELSPYKRLNANCIRGHVSEGKLFQARYHRNVPIKGIEVIFMPGYYEEYLKEKYAGEFPEPKAAFLSVDGATDFPQLVLLLRQIQNYRGTGAPAKLFYESKAAEALSLIAEKSREQKGSLPGAELAKEDLLRLDAVKSYIQDHFAFEIRTEELAKIACMGQTKLRYSFKKQYGVTMTEYIQNRRIAQAEYLLTATDFPVYQIAQAVGCRHAGRFAGLFWKTTGLYPEEYRRLMQR